MVLLVGYDAANYFAPWPDVETHFLDYLNVRFLITSPGAPMRDPRWLLRYDGGDGRIFENTGVLPRFYPVRNVIIDFNDDRFYHNLRDMNEKWPHTGLLEELELENQRQHDDFFNARPADAPVATSEIIEAGPSDYRIHVRAPRYTLMVSSIPYWPGWKVERNGARAEPLRVNGGFLGFAVPAGELDVRVWYDPWTYRFGLIIAAATALGLIGWAFRRRDLRR
jgi:hypothetical protein